MTTNFIFSEAIRKSQEISTKIFSIMIYKSKNGLTWEHFNPVRCHVREQIILLFYGMVGSLSTAAMMARRDLVICTNAV
jgi:GT2 family glycosyltransferase